MEKDTTETENADNLKQKKEHRKKRHQVLLTKLFLDFSKNTTLHGLRYVTQIGLSIVENTYCESTRGLILHATFSILTILQVVVMPCVKKDTTETENADNLKQKKEHRKKRHQLLLTKLFLDFSKNTTLHGLRYVTQKGLSIVEKIFWIIMFVISVVLCIILIQQVWYKWRDSPIIVTINQRMIPVEEVPFPAITVCPQKKIITSKYEYTKQYQKYKRYVDSGYIGPINDTIEAELKMLDDVMLVCDTYDQYSYVLKRNTTDESTVENIIKIAPKVSDAFVMFSTWGGKNYLSDKMFDQVLTSEGVCFTFNTIRQEGMFKNESIQHQYPYIQSVPTETRWSFIFLFPANENIKVYPRRGRQSVGTPDLDVMFKQNVNNNDGLCNSIYNGFNKVYLHHPKDMPQSSLFYYSVLPGQVTSLAVKFSAMSTAESLIKYPPNLRQCYFPKEHELQYFKSYTFNNCRLECLSIYTYQKCGCISFYMPHSNSSEICTAKKRRCVVNARKELASEKPTLSMRDRCNCLPSCNTVEYDADVLKSNFEYSKYQKLMYNHQAEIGLSYSRLEVYFKKPRFMSMQRSELFGLTDFLASCGGLLGLFLGFSFLSIVEVFYFCTLRLWYALKRDKKPEEKNRDCKGPKKY